MATLDKFKSKSYPFTLDFGDGDVVNGRVRAHSQGSKEAEALKKKFESAADDDKEAARTVYQLFIDQIAEWDLSLEKDGPTIPLTVEGLEEADPPFRFLIDILQGAHEEAQTRKNVKRTR